jgi:hypothetical protein
VSRCVAPLAVAALVLVGTAACAGDGAETAESRVLAVPADYETIQAAVDDARAGDLVLVSPGVYVEEVTIDEGPGNFVIRGTDRNDVILDGEFELDDGIVATVDGIAVENLTVRNYLSNGVLFTGLYDTAELDGTASPVVGYRASYVTAHNNGLYGIYAFFAESGVIEHSYASGHPSAGVYIGQCQPCDAVVRDVVAESNAIGFHGTNASGPLTIEDSLWRDNRVGILMASQEIERLAPQRGAIVTGNTVEANANVDAPEPADGAFGFGIVVAGGQENVLEGNDVRDHPSAGIALLDDAVDGYVPRGNTVRANRLDGNGLDLLAASSEAASDLGSCFDANSFATSEPAQIEVALGCDAVTISVLPTVEITRGPAGVDFRTIAPAPPQPQMPDAITAPARPGAAP